MCLLVGTVVRQNVFCYVASARVSSLGSAVYMAGSEWCLWDECRCNHNILMDKHTCGAAILQTDNHIFGSRNHSWKRFAQYDVRGWEIEMPSVHLPCPMYFRNICDITAQITFGKLSRCDYDLKNVSIHAQYIYIHICFVITLALTCTLYVWFSARSSVSVVSFGRGDSESDSEDSLNRLGDVSGLQADAGVASCVMMRSLMCRWG